MVLVSEPVSMSIELNQEAEKGVISIQTTERNGDVVSAHAVTDDHRLMLITEAGQMICIGASDLRVIGRNTQGVKLFDLKENDRLVSAAVLDPEEIKEEPDNAEENASDNNQ